jgi:hypothetical protein
MENWPASGYRTDQFRRNGDDAMVEDTITHYGRLDRNMAIVTLIRREWTVQMGNVGSR